MSDISLSKAVRSNLLSLQNTSTLMAKTQERLATGNKVNSALDNPTNFFTASALNSRAGDLNALMDSMANGVQTLQAADNGLKSITKTLESMQSTLRQARQDKSFQTKSFTLDPATITGTAGDTRQLSFTGGAFGTDVANIDLTKATNNAVVGDTFTAAAASTGAEVTASAAWGATRTVATDTTFSITANGSARSVTLEAGTYNIDQAATAINADLTTAGSTVRARDNGSGSLEFYDSDTGNTGTGETITITANTGTAALGLTADDTNPNTASGTNAGQQAITVNGVAVTLNGDDHKTAAQAATAINAALKTAGAPEGLKATAADGKLTITGPDNGAAVVIGGLQQNAVFGALADRDDVAATASGDASGPVKSVDELVSEINAKKNADGSDNALYGKIRASNDNGKLRIENLSTQELDIDGVSTDGAVDGTSTGASEILGNSVRASLADQFNELRDQLDKLSDDASFNGINLLRGDKLTITFNETGTSSIDIQTKGEKSVDSSSLGVPTTLSESDMDSDTAIDNFLGQIKTALNDVRSQSSSFGSNLSIVQNRQDFTKNMINTLQTGAANLTLADMNEEAANLLALQTRQSLSSSSLSLASQADQSVLQLIR
jgi:flagellin